MPIRLRNEAYSPWMSCPSNDTFPRVGFVVPTITFASVDLPAPDGPITAVSVPDRAENEMLFNNVSPCSIIRLMWRTSKPPVRILDSVSVRRIRVPLWNTRSTLPIVTTSPSRSSAPSTRVPLTNVPLMLRASRISTPSGLGTNVA
jgi:hypothetical protein